MKINKDSIIEGLIIPVFKPFNWTSFDVVKKIKILISDNAFIEKELKRNIVNIPVCYDPSILSLIHI